MKPNLVLKFNFPNLAIFLKRKKSISMVLWEAEEALKQKGRKDS